MSIRMTAHFLMQNGRIILRCLKNNKVRYVSSYSKNIHVVPVGRAQGRENQSVGGNSVTGRHLRYIGAQARRIFVDNILKRVTNSLAADLRRRAANRFLFGDSGQFFALVGISLASGTGIITKEDELEGVCWEIREAVSKVKWNTHENDKNYEITITAEQQLTLKDFVIGPLLAKGCSAAVYAVRMKTLEEKKTLSDLIIDYNNINLSVYPLSIKMMFNYDAESNALSILRSMYRETVPARKYYKNKELGDWEQRMAECMNTLPPHPNIVAMYYVFADRVEPLPDSLQIYPDALPTRLNPSGSGRNMSLFLVMKRYDMTLKEFMAEKKVNVRQSILLLAQLLEGVAHMNSNGIAHRDLKCDNILLDLSEKSDNCPSLAITDFGCCLANKTHGLYLPYNSHDVDKGGNAALMAPEVITAEPGSFTNINYTKADLWTVGSIAYEVFGMKNPFYGNENQNGNLKNYNYSENDLPSLPETVPPVIVALVKNILSRNLHKRLSAQMAATVMQLYLWAPNSWLEKEKELPSSNEIMQWLLCLTTKVLCEGRIIDLNLSTNDVENNVKRSEQKNYYRPLSTRSGGRRTMPEYQLIASFLSRVNLKDIKNGLKWIQKNVY